MSVQSYVISEFQDCRGHMGVLKGEEGLGRVFKLLILFMAKKWRPYIKCVFCDNTN